MLFSFALEYAIGKVQGNQVGLKINGAHQLLIYDNDINLLGDIINVIRQNTGTLLEAGRDAGLEIIAEKTKYMMSRHPNSGQNQNIRIANESFENLATFKYLGTTLADQTDIHDEIKSMLAISPKSFVFPSCIKKNKDRNTKYVILPVMLHE
jgi:hypothetical protein